ncbi:MAG: hypothetical protein CMB80_12685 [Flammeovirgaceae bacterium]|nr:hypothetical protein [Flammeovirgaceae bacterium]MBE62554.1 hypothetical protein [Flammeovirgaceae bacterium]HCX23893.1 hypothetical protein [Cytophagales bacterium]
MKRYTITKYHEYPAVQLYTVEFEGLESNETDLFISRFSSLEEHSFDFNAIISWINRIGEYGALERYFRPEKRACAIPISSGHNLRLYCFRVTDEILILGNGGVKSSQKVKNSPDCFPHFEIMNQVATKVYWALKNEKLKIAGRELIGKLNFKTQS